VIFKLSRLFFFLATFVLTSCASQPVYPLPEATVDAREAAVDITEKSKPILLERLEAKKAEWKTKEPSHYKYFYTNSSYFVCGVNCGPLEVEVKDAKIVSVIYRGKRRGGFLSGDVLPKDEWFKYGIVQLLSKEVEFIQNAKPLSGDGWTEDDRLTTYIDYDTEWGFPRIIASEHPYHYHGKSKTVIYDFQLFE